MLEVFLVLCWAGCLACLVYIDDRVRRVYQTQHLEQVIHEQHKLCLWTPPEAPPDPKVLELRELP